MGLPVACAGLYSTAGIALSVVAAGKKVLDPDQNGVGCAGDSGAV